MKEETASLQSDAQAIFMAQRENESVREAARQAAERADLVEAENRKMAENLQRQETLYTELKKMRGRGEELEFMQELQAVRQQRCLWICGRPSSTRCRA